MIKRQKNRRKEIQTKNKMINPNVENPTFFFYKGKKKKRFLELKYVKFQIEILKLQIDGRMSLTTHVIVRLKNTGIEKMS